MNKQFDLDGQSSPMLGIRPVLPVNPQLFLSLYGLLGCLIVSLVMLYRSTYKPTWLMFIASLPGVVCLIGLAGSCALVVHVAQIVRSSRRSGRESQKCVIRTIRLYALSVTLLLGSAEFGLRVLAVPGVAGEEVLGKLLLPRGWHLISSRYGQMVQQLDRYPSYYQEDPVLGWTIRPNHSSSEGLFHSGPQGIRTASRGFSYDTDASCRISLIGDSFTFGEEAKFEETWSYYLQAHLSSKCQVKNFAVPSYSIGQMYLRLRRDMIPDRPDVIIVGFTDGALERTFGVYCFLMGLEWPDSPWIAPRLGLVDDQLVVLNAPLPAPRDIYTERTIRDLPRITYDRWYHTMEWEQASWGQLYQSYLFRFLTTLYPLHNVTDSQVSDSELERVNAALFNGMRDMAQSHRAKLLFVYFPMMEDYGYRVRARVPISHALLQREGIPFIDATRCLGEIPIEQRFLRAGVHYTPEGERAIADCLLPEIAKLLPDMREQMMEPARGNVPGGFVSGS